jgi:hypothetical protein
VLTSGSGGIEVGTRRLNAAQDLLARLEASLGRFRGFLVYLTFDSQPLKLGEQRSADLVEDIVTALERGTTSIRFEDVGLTVGVVQLSDSNPSGAVLTGNPMSADLSVHMAEVEREIGNKIAEKRRQAAKMPTALFLDFSRVGNAWLRSNDVWVARLSTMLEGKPFAALGLLITSLDRWEPLSVAITVSDSAPAALSAELRHLAEKLGWSARNH